MRFQPGRRVGFSGGAEGGPLGGSPGGAAGVPPHGGDGAPVRTPLRGEVVTLTGPPIIGASADARWRAGPGAGRRGSGRAGRELQAGALAMLLRRAARPPARPPAWASAPPVRPCPRALEPWRAPCPETRTRSPRRDPSSSPAEP